jgi:hypothetical protein
MAAFQGLLLALEQEAEFEAMATRVELMDVERVA